MPSVKQDYDINNSKVESPFQAEDIAGVVPVIKYVVFTSADGRSLLEESKSALDKGRLFDLFFLGGGRIELAIFGIFEHETLRI